MREALAAAALRTRAKLADVSQHQSREIVPANYSRYASRYGQSAPVDLLTMDAWLAQCGFWRKVGEMQKQMVRVRYKYLTRLALPRGLEPLFSP